MNLEQLIDRLKRTPSFMENVTHWETLPAKEARFAPFPEALDSRLPPVLAARGVHQLYTHQREAFDRVAEDGISAWSRRRPPAKRCATICRC